MFRDGDDDRTQSIMPGRGQLYPSRQGVGCWYTYIYRNTSEITDHDHPRGQGARVGGGGVGGVCVGGEGRVDSGEEVKDDGEHDDGVHLDHIYVCVGRRMDGGGMVHMRLGPFSPD
jgi:hypothetical protein